MSIAYNEWQKEQAVFILLTVFKQFPTGEKKRKERKSSGLT